MNPLLAIRNGLSIWRDDVDAAAASLPGIGGLFSRQWRVLLVETGELTYINSQGDSESFPSGSDPEIGKAIISRLGQKGPLVIRLGTSLGFQREANFPIAAKRHLTDAVSLALPRLSPLPADDVTFAIDLKAKIETEGRIKLPVHMVRKSVIEEALKTASELGLKVSAIDLQNGDVQAAPLYDLREAHGAPSSGRSAFGLVAGLTTAFVLIGAGFALDNAIRLDPAYQEARRPASIEARLEAAIAHAQAKSNSGSVVAALSDLSRRLPDSAYISDFNYESGDVRISGLAWDAAAALRALDASPEFTGSNFDGATVRDEETGRERFTITARHQMVQAGGTP